MEGAESTEMLTHSESNKEIQGWMWTEEGKEVIHLPCVWKTTSNKLCLKNVLKKLGIENRESSKIGIVIAQMKDENLN